MGSIEIICSGCGARVPASLLLCPACRRLIHASDLKNLSSDASAAEAAGNLSEALTLWRRALELLPSDVGQYSLVADKIKTLSDRGVEIHRGHWNKKLPSWLASLGVAGLLAWKFKAVLILILTKAKFILWGFGQTGTLFSMLAFFGVYWSAWGWKFAAGLVLSIYIHEMGHVAALRRYGIDAGAPMFIPGLGAFVRLKQHPASVREDAVVGLAGPLWGLGAVLAAWGVSLGTGWAGWAATAKTAALINLFNLMPFWQLDGGRGFRALSRNQAAAVTLITGGLFYFTREGLLILIIIGGVLQVLTKKNKEPGDVSIFFLFISLVGALTFLGRIPVRL